MNLDEMIGQVDILRLAADLGIHIEKNNKARCIFHDEKTPSLTFFPETHSFFCYGCNRSGNVFDLVIKQRDCSFGDAVRYICNYLGIQYTHTISQEINDSTPHSGLDLAYKIYKDNNNLDKKNNLQEWAKERKIHHNALLRWGAIYIEGNEISRQKKLNIGQWEGLHSSGMIYQGDLKSKNQLYLNLGYKPQDFFYIPGILIPIKDTSGTINGFVCRKVDAQSKHPQYPKYKYNQYFAKSFNLFGADIVEKSIEKFLEKNDPASLSVFDIFIVEGILDAIRLNHLDFCALALMGTSLSVSREQSDGQKNQFEILKAFAKKLSKYILKIHIFLDNDAPGIKGGQKIASQMVSLCGQCDNVIFDYIVVNPQKGKDPDEILIGCSHNQALEVMQSSILSPNDFLIAVSLGFFLDSEKFNFEDMQNTWENTPYYAQHNILRTVHNQLSDSSFYNPKLLLFGGINTSSVDSYIKIDSIFQKKSISTCANVYNDNNIPWHNIVEKARVSYADSDFPIDYTSWDRIKCGLPVFKHYLFNIIVDKEIIEPFMVSIIPRSNDDEYPRMLALPSPEDLVIETAFLYEILNYAIYHPGEIPLVFNTGGKAETYYKNKNKVIDTVSFAYQFNCLPESVNGIYESQGLFRHFVDCWNDYNQYLIDKANNFPFDKGEIWCMRLDIHRYYDSICKRSVKKLFEEILDEKILNTNDAIPIINRIAGIHPDLKRNKIVQWICHKCFDFSYYAPLDGKIVSRKDNTMGIPQGPNLSAWIANILLFDLDDAVVQHCNTINEKYRRTHNFGDKASFAWYARYVDDMIVVAPTKDEAEQLKSLIQKRLSDLGLSLSEKIEDDEIATIDSYRDMIRKNRGVISEPYSNMEFFFNDFNKSSFAWATLSNYLDRKNLLTYIHSMDALIATQEQPQEMIKDLHNAVFASVEVRYRDYRKVMVLVSHIILGEQAGPSYDITTIVTAIEAAFRLLNGEFNKEKVIIGESYMAIYQIWPFFATCEALQQILISSYNNTTLPRDCKEKLNRNRKILAELIFNQGLIGKLKEIFAPNNDSFYGFGYNAQKWEMALMASAKILLNNNVSSVKFSSELYYSLFRYALPLRVASEISIEEESLYPHRTVVFQFHDLIYRLQNNLNAPLSDFKKISPILYFKILCDGGAPDVSLDDTQNENLSNIYFDAIATIAIAVDPDNHFSVLQKRDYLLCYIVSKSQEGIIDSKLRLLPSPQENCEKHILAFDANEESISKVIVILPTEDQKVQIYPNLNFKVLELKSDCHLNIYSADVSTGQYFLQSSFLHNDLLNKLIEFKKIYESLRTIPNLNSAVISAANIIRNREAYDIICWQNLACYNFGLLKNGDVRDFPPEFSMDYKLGCAALEYVGLSVPPRPKDAISKLQNSSLDFSKNNWIDDHLVWYSQNLFSGNFPSQSLSRLSTRIKYLFDFLSQLHQNQLSEADKIVSYFTFRLELMQWISEKRAIDTGICLDEKGSLIFVAETIASLFFRHDPALCQYLQKIVSSQDTYSNKVFQIERKNVYAWYCMSELTQAVIEKSKQTSEDIIILPLVFKVYSVFSYVKTLCYDLTLLHNIDDILSLLKNNNMTSIDILTKLGLDQTTWYRDEKNNQQLSLNRIQNLFAAFKKTSRNTNDQNIFPMGFAIILYIFIENLPNHDGRKLTTETLFELFCITYEQLGSKEIVANKCDLLIDKLQDLEHEYSIESKTNSGFDPCNSQRNIIKTIYNKSQIYDQHQFVVAAIGSGHYIEHVDGTYFWSETWSNNKLLNIATMVQPLADYINILKHEKNTDESTVVKNDTNVIIKNGPTDSPIPKSSDQSDVFPSKSKIDLSTELYNMQEKLWQSRRTRNRRRVRVAFCQFNVGHSSYCHADDKDRKKPENCPYCHVDGKAAKRPENCSYCHFDDKNVKGSENCPDYRITKHNQDKNNLHIIKVLEKAIEMCNDLNVDLLLLPEYSVSHEVLNDAIQHLKGTKSKLKIWAGTFRNSNDLSEFNNVDLDRSFDKIKIPHKAHLCVIDQSGIIKTRGKKYPAIALQEDFCPTDETIKPLFDKSSGAEKFVLELICSEIFMATSPANIIALAVARRQLADKYFPRVPNGPSYTTDVIKDLIEFSKNVGFYSDQEESRGNEIFEDFVRKTILFIPACTTRAPDFHILGQSNYLAVGLCSVFCNATSKNKIYAAGQSCFIGFGSTSDENIMPHSPYCGFLPGVLYPPYGRPLDKDEEALVVADIDPYYMNEGKPRQQLLSPPIELVAHIPFISVKGDQMKNITGEIADILKSSHINSHCDELYKKVRNDIKNILEKLHDELNLNPEKKNNLVLRLNYIENEKFRTRADLLPACLYDFCFLEE